jgi:protein-tyrosine phosphatase
MHKFIYFLLLFCPLLAQTQINDSSKRQVVLQGAANFRDIGGYATKDGLHVKWGKIFRSADISKLTDQDLTVLQNKNIDYVVDLRGTDESKKAPDRLNANMNYILCPAGSDSNLTSWMKSIATLKSGGDSMMKAYYANTDYLADRYKPLFAKLIGLPDGDALVMHCTAGKDRTGIGSALLLYSLGVPYDTIMSDYLASNYYRKKENEKMVNSMVQYMHVNEQVAEDMAGVRKEYLDETFKNIRLKYGSVDNFLKGPMQLNDEKITILKKKFLE